MRRARDPQAQQAALSLLARGLASPGEIAALAGVSRQLVEQWARSAGVDWRRMKTARLAQEWRTALSGKRPPTRKVRLRRMAAAAKSEWDAGHGQGPKAAD